MKIAGKLIAADGDSAQAPADAATSWQAMRDSLSLSAGNEAADMATIESWHADNAGHLNAPDGTIPMLSTGTIEVDDAWLTTNEDGTHVYQSGGRWVVDSIEITGRLETKTSDVTFRRCRIDMTNNDSWGMGHDPFYSAPYRNLEFEWITIDGGDQSTGDAFSFYTDDDITDNLLFRHMDIFGMKSGLRLYGGETVTYSYVHDPFFESGLHSAAASVRGDHVNVSRNLLIGANSGALAVYADNPPGLDDILVEENSFARISDVGTGYCTNHNKDDVDEGGPNSTNCRLIDNLYGTRCNGSVGNYWNTVTGNLNLSGGSVG